MRAFSDVALCLMVMHCALAVKLKVVMHSEQDDSKVEEDEGARSRGGVHQRKEATSMPFLKHAHAPDDRTEAEDEKPPTAPAPLMHPNDMIFPLIYRQSHVNSMFKFGENWYTWSTERRTDGTKATDYYICYDEPKHCDDVGWERTESLPKCAFQIDALLPEDRACINSFGVEPHVAPGVCDGAEQMKVSEMVRACGPRVRSLWRFVRVGRRPAGAAKPADVNSLVCEDEEECYITIEYRIHHDRITFSLHEPTRGQTFKSALTREVEHAAPPKPRAHRTEHAGKAEANKSRARAPPPDAKGVLGEHDDSAYRHTAKNKIKVREDVSEDISE